MQLDRKRSQQYMIGGIGGIESMLTGDIRGLSECVDFICLDRRTSTGAGLEVNRRIVRRSCNRNLQNSKSHKNRQTYLDRSLHL